ncbi:f2r [Pungitius sinensis]
MNPLNILALVLFPLHSVALASQNGSASFLRTFSGHFKTVSGGRVDYVDLSLDSLTDDNRSVSESPQESAKRHSLHRDPKKQFFVSQETKGFLQGRLTTSFVPTVYTLVFLAGVPLNLVAMVMFVHQAHPRKPAVIYMLNLACADLLFGLLLPFKIAYHYHGNNWIYGCLMCRVVTAAFYCNMYCSVLLLTCISVDRFLAVVYPIGSLTWRGPHAASAACAAMWLLALGGASPLLVSGQTVYLSDLGITTCHDVQDLEKLRAHYVYFFPIYSSVFFFVPLAFTAVCYVRVIQALAAANVAKRFRKTRAAAMAAAVLAVFVACFTPTNVILMVHYVRLSHGSSDGSYQAYLLSTCVGSLSCCLDPVLYYVASSRCQKQVAALLRCRRRAQAKSSSGTQGSAARREERQQQVMQDGELSHWPRRAFLRRFDIYFVSSDLKSLCKQSK